METKQCVSCKQVKPISEYNYKHRLIGKLHTHCRECQKGYKRKHYETHKEAYIAKAARQKEEAVKRNHQLVAEYLRMHPCVDCGEADIIVLEFDHRSSKDRPIARLVQSGLSWQKILSEIEKCDVRCANCHRRKTARERKYFKFLGL
jgi:hypothetical protein